MATVAQGDGHRLKGSFPPVLVSQPPIRRPGRLMRPPSKMRNPSMIPAGSWRARRPILRGPILSTGFVGVRFKKAGPQIGYPQFETAPDTANHRSIDFFDERGVTFDTNTVSNERMREVPDCVRNQAQGPQCGKCRDAGALVVHRRSAAGESKRFESLPDGVARVEFDAP